MTLISGRPAVAAIIAVGVAAMLAAGCASQPPSAGSGGSPGAGRSASPAAGPADVQLVAFSPCVRSHGVPAFPDPPSGAVHVKFPSAQQLHVSSAELSSAENACQHLLPAGADDQFPAAELPLL